MTKCTIMVNSSNIFGCFDCVHCEVEDIWHECTCKLKNHYAETPNMDCDIAFICEDFKEENADEN